ncbi:putative circularly permuted ATP-grasp superfamily protein/putative alpha-E superfamily protein [Sphingobium sp. B11D3B]|uniref:circularly permuted type 2 ATP-grasp protein n=1 Tax=Sphingobium sp. B11D3B TaxID=2940575 RepID=UPI0022260D84|nr:circularly permuted type 2 ATP-grasp protein [Sphingobium sp. B11D3B]MCW2389944.1 putative circularly permuted ATP-grasp superfamily protein/putative alpha-E superfamily protein [Sphingobium sp. B11D3B]
MTAGEEDIGQALARYAREAGRGDLMLAAQGDPAMAHRWEAMFGAIASAARGGFAGLQARADQQVVDLGMAFRLTGEVEERVWPLSPVPMLIHATQWQGIEAGLAQRADLLEHVLDDLYGACSLVASGELPAAIVAGAPDYWRQMRGLPPPRGHRLQFYAVDLARGPDGEWRVLADYVRTPVGAGYALENRLAMTRATDDALGIVNFVRLAPFFSDFRQGLAAVCARPDPRIALLTQGRYNQSYAEQAHLARYLGILLVEGQDLTVRDGQLYVRTVEGVKRVDGLWRRMGTDLLDPLAFDSRSTIGVPDIFEAMRHGSLVIANWPGAGVLETPALAAFLPRLCRKLLGEPLRIPNVATWWCGQAKERAHVREQADRLAIGSAFGLPVPAIPHGRARLASRLSPAENAAFLAELEQRPMDYIGQELVQLSTTPALVDGVLLPRPFILRAFLARDAHGQWRAMPGGFARLAAHDDMRAVLMGQGDMSADVCIVADEPQTAVVTLDSGAPVAIRRVAGTLPSKAADNFFWLARYLERGEMVLRMIRVLIGGSIEGEAASALDRPTLGRVADTLVAWGSARKDKLGEGTGKLCVHALSDPEMPGSVQSLFEAAEAIGRGLRERLAVDFWRLLSRQIDRVSEARESQLMAHVARLLDRCAALSGLSAENMVRGAGWRFLELGRRLERAIHLCRLARTFAGDDANGHDLNLFLDLCDCQISYRTRYLSGLALAPVRDMLLLEPGNPRSLAFQVDAILDHLRALPTLRDDGMPEPPVQLALALSARLHAASAEMLTARDLEVIETALLDLSDRIDDRFFLKGEDAPRASGMTRLA